MPTDPDVQTATQLTADIKQLAAAIGHVYELVDRLIQNPVDRTAYYKLQEYLDGQAWAAADSYDRLTSSTPEELLAQINRLLATDPGRFLLRVVELAAVRSEPGEL